MTRLLAFQDATRRLTRSAGLRGTAFDVADAIISRPVFTIAQVATEHGIKRQTATVAVNHLVAAGIVREATGRTYDRVFISDGVVRILED